MTVPSGAAEPATLDELSDALGRLRAAAGSPSYAEIARRIGAARITRDPAAAEPGKVTVYDCFRRGRRRVDDVLVGEIAAVLGGDGSEWRRWQEIARRVNGARLGVHVEASLGDRPADQLVGRDDLVDGLDEAIDVVVLSGMPGVGKSTLATHLAGVFGAPTLTVELRESDIERPAAGPVDVLRRMLGALGHRSTPHHLGELRDRWSRALADRPLTVILEDASSVETLAHVIVPSPGVRYIVTSRSDVTRLAMQPTMADVPIILRTVPPLAVESSRSVLAGLLGAEANSSNALDRIAAVSGGLPLDLVMIAATMREHPRWSLDDFADRFEREARDTRMRHVLGAALRGLRADDAHVLLRMALVDREIDEGVLVAAGGGRALGSIDRLVAGHLLQRADSRVRMHDTVFAFCRERALVAESQTDRSEFVRRLVSAVLESLRHDDGFAVRQYPTVLAVASLATDYDGVSAERIALAAHPALTEWSMWNATLELHDLAARSTELSSAPEIALNVAQAAEKLGRYDEALAILHRVRRVASGVASARTWNQIGNVERWLGHFDDALGHYERAISIAAECGDAAVEGRAVGNHADTLRVLARYPLAEVGYERALTLAAAAGDELNRRIVLTNRALLWTATGRFDEAEFSLRTLIDEAGERAMPSQRIGLAFIAEARGDDEAAARLAHEAERAAAAAGEYSVSSDSLLLRARIDGRAGEADRAIESAGRVLRDAEIAGSPLIVTEAANTLAEIELGAGRLDDAERHAADAIVVAEVTGDLAELPRATMTRAGVARRRGDGATAATLEAEARAAYRAIGHRLGAAAPA
ncbi:tetratricopeptide repeat protein [Agromyces atrinae]|uniref:tetratricopeptide repeat protein n=1 Tax=Agromyces atrinae TaxID=592376 RepID=UPI001F5920B6|nr:tetratricopeptide repeat protein [Agromyces atrinae]MCI2956807.1 tetratricopeptide repeat protein [Agromyces atrinae]